MSNKKDYFNKCFSPNWIEVDLEMVDRQQKEVAQNSNESYKNVRTYENREVRLENKRRKDLNTLLKELDEIKQNIEKAAEKQQRLANLMGFYTGEFAQ
jgi:flagellar motility protein MotE (MotC chaperone)